MALTAAQVVNAMKTRDVEYIFSYCFDNGYSLADIVNILEIRKRIVNGD